MLLNATGFVPFVTNIFAVQHPYARWMGLLPQESMTINIFLERKQRSKSKNISTGDKNSTHPLIITSEI